MQGKGKKVSTCEEAAGTVGSMATCNAPNQEAFRVAGALPLLLELVLTAERSIKASQNHPASALFHQKTKICSNLAVTTSSSTIEHPRHGSVHHHVAKQGSCAIACAQLLRETQTRLMASLVDLQEQAAWALHAMTGKSEACMEDMVGLEAPARLLPLLSHMELWNWTPVVSTMHSMSAGTQQAQHALVRADAMTVFLDVLSFGRPTLQVTPCPYCCT